MKKIYVILALLFALSALNPLVAAGGKKITRSQTPPPPPLAESEDVPPPPAERGETPPPPAPEGEEAPPPPPAEEEEVAPPPPAQTVFDTLIDAIHDNDMQKVNAAFKAGAKINDATSFGYTPLEYAVVDGNAKMVERLLLEKPNLFHKIGKTGQTALVLADALAHADEKYKPIAAMLEKAYAQDPLVIQEKKRREEFLTKIETQIKEAEALSAQEQQKTTATPLQDPYSKQATDKELLDVLQAFEPYESMLGGKRNPEPATYAKRLGIDASRIKAIANDDDNPAYIFLELYVGKGPLTSQQKRKVKAALTYFVVDKKIKKWFLEGWQKGVYNDLESLPAMSFFYWVEKNDSKQAAQELKVQAQKMISK